MAVVKESTIQFYESVKKEYHRLLNIKADGIPVYTQDYILSRVGKKFFRSARTVENIVFNRV
ncbi:MAG: hypothetical protein K1X81_01960 [Bacteroidia bacterium]|nr:hypothetical protein [Bacteroidia bacterium]